MASESIYFNSKSIVGPTSVVVGSTYLPQTTLQATGTTTLIGNVFVQGGVLYPPGPMTANSTTLSGFAYGNGTYVAFAPEQANPANAYLAFDGDITTVSDSVTGTKVYNTASPYNYSNTTITGGFSNTFDVTSTNYPGVYIQLQMPAATVLEYYTIFPSGLTIRAPGTWRVFGSQTGAIGTWVSLDSRASITWRDPQVSQTFYLSPVPVAYLYFRLSVQNLVGGDGILDVSQWNLYGRPPVPAMSILGGDLSISSGGGLIVGSGTLGSNVAIFSNVGGGSNVVVINSNAWVGIGTTSPTASLQVVGDVVSSNSIQTSNIIATGSPSSGGTSLIATTQGIGSNVFVFSNTAGATSNNSMAMDSNAIVLIGIPPSTAANYGGAQFYNAKARLYVAGGGTSSQPMNIVLYNPNLTNSNQQNGICFGGGGGASWHLVSSYDGGGRCNFILGGDSGGGLNQYHKFTTTGLCVNSQLGVAQGANVFHVLGYSTSNIAYFSNVAGGPNAVVINSNAWVGIGTSTPSGPLSVAGYSSANLALFTSSTPGGANVVVINSNAWVGIGTTNPTSSLQVNGNASFATDTFAVPFATVGTMGVLSGLTIGPSSTTLGSNLAVFANASGGSNVTIFTGNALSIGTLTPTATLHVVGSMGSNIAVFSNGFSNGVIINQWSNVGIGLGNPIVQLDLSTDGARKLSTTTWTTGSDQRVKSNIVDANLITCYDTIKSINLKYFQWNFPDAQPIDNHSLGFIAQEIAEYFPKSVFPSDSHGFSDFLSLNTDQILKAMFGALKKTIDDKETLEEKLEMAQNDIDLLETRLSDLEAIVCTLIPQKETTQTGPRSAALINQM